ncbi:tyrosine-type recombinase/integrase [Roseimaritima multifibrata]
MSHEEWKWFIEWAPKNPSTRWNISAPTRTLLYSVAILTGLRANELFTLQSERMNTQRPPFFVLANSSDTKNGELARQWVGSDTASKLSSHIESNPDDRTVFEGMPNSDGTAAMFRDDLAFTRRKYEQLHNNPDKYFLAVKNRSGDDLDFHCLRYTCGAWLALDKVHPKAIQTVMRHSTITLTMDRYGHLFPAMEHEAIQALERFM